MHAIIRTALFSLSLSVAGLACAPANTSNGVAALASPVLRAYEVPDGMQADVASVLNNLLWRGEGQPKVGNVGVAPDGQVLVSAPAEFHPGVEALVASMKSGKAGPPPSLTLDVWLLMATPAEAATPGATVANDVAAVVDELQASQGPMHVELLERTQLHMTSGSHAFTEGLEMGIDTQATLSGDGVLANLKLRRRAGAEGRLDVRTVLPVGKTVVLGQVGAIGTRRLDGQKPTPATAFYVVRASRTAR